MSRIQDILSKAERDGTARRTRALPDDARVTSAGSTASGVAEPPRPAVPHAPRRTFRTDAFTAVAPAEATDAYPVAPPGAREDAFSGTERDFQPATAQIDPLLVAALSPTSIAAEQYRALRTRLKSAERDRALRTIAVTSPAKGDGKSITAANLALTMAQEFQQRVLLLDADLRRPAVHRLFGVADTPGLADVLMNMAEVDQALVAVPDYHLTVMPAGVPPARPAELLGSATMRRTLETLRGRFDRIVVDVPPVAPLADLHILTPMIDGLLMIVRAGVTQKPAIESALAGLDRSKVLGLVLNEAGGRTADGYAYDGYGYIAG